MSISSRYPDTILVNRAPGETRYALLAGEDLVEVVHRRDAEVQPGAIYLGRAGAKVPGFDAVFVSFGDTDDGVLPVKGRLPSQGAAVPVVVVVPARADKGAELKHADIPVPEGSKAPCLLHAAPEPVDVWWQCYRDGIARIICAPRRESARVKALLEPEAPVEEAAEGSDLFAMHGVDAAIEAALSPVVPLPSGGSLIIEPTAAIVAIDINAGPAYPGIANNDALVAVAVELRRRNIAGHILIDIIPGRRRGELPKRLMDALSPDPIPANVAGLTPLGMIELTRKRVGLSLAQTLCAEDGALSAATVAYKLLRDAVGCAFTQKAAHIEAAAAPDVIALLQGPLRAALSEAEDMTKSAIALVPRPQFPRGRTDVRAA